MAAFRELDGRRPAHRAFFLLDRMTPERWKRIEEVYHAARARPEGERAAFLAEACRDDDALRREVESLLTEETSDEGFLEPALVIAARMVSDAASSPMIGRSLAGYQLLALLGAGGMGEVYRARDTKLGREVAIKILPHEFTSHPDRLARFDREARMLAALNHPNICAIYGFEEAVAVRFLVLELVEGMTLADMLANLPRTHSGGNEQSPRDAIVIARQIADALEVAHEKGIIHRDLKPANIKITPEGVVKVLDFGLAKAVGGNGSTPDLTHAPGTTRGGKHGGAVMGTAAYMSPEQARGLTVDKRTDIWAFGCVLYEMLTGKVTFAGDTASDSIARILEREPDWSALPATTPASIRRVLFRCLAKDSKQRLRDIADVRIELDAIEEVLPGTFAVEKSRASKRLSAWLPWAALVAAAVAVGVREAGRPALEQESSFAKAEFRRLTDWEGTEGDADISPDGKFVAFLSDRDGEPDIWLIQLATGQVRNLTASIPALRPPGAVVRSLGFSGDGSEIWFHTSGGPPLLMPSMGGSPRPFLGAGSAAPAWSPDNGARLAYFRNGPGDPIFVADSTGGDAVEVLPPVKEGAGVSVHHHHPIWSPDSKWIFFAGGRASGSSFEMDVWRVRPSGEELERLTHQNTAVRHLAFVQPRTVVYVAPAEDKSGVWLWELDVPSKLVRRVNAGVDQYTSVAASRDGRRVVASVINVSASLWRVPLAERSLPLAGERDVRPYLPFTGRALAPRFGGQSLFYVSSRGAGDGLWRFANGEASEVWKGAEVTLREPPAVSPDGRRVAVVITRGGKRHLTIMSADGTDARTLADIDTQGDAGQSTADWSPDGKWIVTAGSDSGGRGLFKIPVDGGKPVRLVSGDAVNPAWSPDESLIVYSGTIVGGKAPLLGVRPDGTVAELPPALALLGSHHRFLPDGRGLVYMPLGASQDFWLLDLDTKTSHRLTHLGNQGRIRTFDVTPDGKHIVFDRHRENSDVVLIERPAE